VLKEGLHARPDRSFLRVGTFVCYALAFFAFSERICFVHSGPKLKSIAVTLVPLAVLLQSMRRCGPQFVPSHEGEVKKQIGGNH